METTPQEICTSIVRPHKFFGIVSLRTGTEIIALSLFFNKVTGLYGLMAILTGFALSAAQLTMYLYSVIVVGALVWLLPRVRRREAAACLGLAWLYAADTIIHTAFTAFFAVDWYLQAGQQTSPFTSMENMTSLGLAALFTVLRVYCSLVVAANGRQALRRMSGGHIEDPFPIGSEAQAAGWQGQLGRFITSFGKDYWLGLSEEDGDSDDEDWMRGLGYKHVRGGAIEDEDEPRRLRARRGTGVNEHMAGPGLPSAAR